MVLFCRLDLKFIFIPLHKSRDKNLPYTRTPHHPHGQGPSIPVVEITYENHLFGLRCPDTKFSPLAPLVHRKASSQHIVELIMRPLVEEMRIHFSESRQKGVRVV